MRAARERVVGGRMVVERRCAKCTKWKACTTPNFNPLSRDRRTRRVLRWDCYCRPCRREVQRQRWANRAEAERAREAERQRAARERRRVDAQARERDRELKRESQRRRMSDPEARERRRQANRAWYERMKRDRARYEAYLERQRIGYRLRRERQGLPLEVNANLSAAKTIFDTRGRQSKTGGMKPVGPISDFVQTFQAANGMSVDVVCARLGITPRMYSAWRSGEREGVDLDVIDRVLSRAGVGWLLYSLYPELDRAGVRIAA